MISPELQRQLNETPRDGVVAAVMFLKEEPPPGEPTKAAVRALLEKVKETGRPSMVNVFDKLSSFVVVGSPDFVQYLGMQPEVSRAIPNGG